VRESQADRYVKAGCPYCGGDILQSYKRQPGRSKCGKCGRTFMEAPMNTPKRSGTFRVCAGCGSYAPRGAICGWCQGESFVTATLATASIIAQRYEQLQQERPHHDQNSDMTETNRSLYGGE